MSSRLLIDPALVGRLHGRSSAPRWLLSVADFAAVLETSVAHAFRDRSPTPADIDRYLNALHLDDLALAAACAAANDAAWDHFIREHRPGLYRAADAIDRTGGGRELADSLYAELFGLKERDGVRQSLFRYFHGRSSLATWVRAVLAQRHVDRARAGRKLDPLPDGDAANALPAPQTDAPNPNRSPRIALVLAALHTAIAALDPRDRLRVSCYYIQNMTLAVIGRLLGEHEGTVSRHLTRTRALIRTHIERILHEEHGLDSAAIDEGIRLVIDDSGMLDLAEIVADPPGDKNGREHRSTE